MKCPVPIWMSLALGCSQARIADSAVTGRAAQDSGGSPKAVGPAARVVFNELMSNGSEESDWLELMNLESTAVDLSGWWVADDSSDGWSIPAGTVMSPGALLVVLADGGPSADTSLSASFKLSSEGETLLLSDPSGELADAVDFPPLGLDRSYGRLPDGLGDWTDALAPTKGQDNRGPGLE